MNEMTRIFETTGQHLLTTIVVLAGITLLWVPNVHSADQANQVPIELRVDSVTVTEPAHGTVIATFTVSRSGPLTVSSEVSVDVSTHNGTAKVIDGDYVPKSMRIKFAPRRFHVPVQVTINDDMVTEPDETFFLDLTNAENAVIRRSTGNATIVDTTPIES